MKTRRHLHVFAQYFIRNLFFKAVTDADKKFGLVKSLFDDIEKWLLCTLRSALLLEKEFLSL